MYLYMYVYTDIRSLRRFGFHHLRTRIPDNISKHISKYLYLSLSLSIYILDIYIYISTHTIYMYLYIFIYTAVRSTPLRDSPPTDSASR